ncbi:DUF6929 family protein [Chitinophaga sp. 22321]|uniref:Phytase-like domain-containing protein n=1 Tax=Chitinophaga hostae TaxID=2831022 RepID=A0ABS5J3W2_9BACT|nr:hypothetical protein [Chitinophaga hostae]MBS0029913.1 hypothetical protein [Chitinophaga hostae]
MKAAITLLYTLLLPDFPSASAIEYFNGKLYVVGDDATCILVLDRDYGVLNSIPVMTAAGKRIPKKEKPDFEASALIQLQGKHHLMVSGSLATEKRRRILLVALEEERTGMQQLDYPAAFIRQLLAAGINELNIEGATAVGNRLLLSNRGNDTFPVNQVIVTSNDFWKSEMPDQFSVLPLTLVTPTRVFAGVSELCYVPGKDMLLCTLSSEATANAYDDGAIGDSYIGWISNISQKLSGTSLTMEGWLNLSATHPAFKAEKMEGICVESVDGNTLLLHLVSDNDGGESRLFKVTLSFFPNEAV